MRVICWGIMYGVLYAGDGMALLLFCCWRGVYMDIGAVIYAWGRHDLNGMIVCASDL